MDMNWAPGVISGTVCAAIVGFGTWIFTLVKAGGKQEAEDLHMVEQARSLRGAIDELQGHLGEAVERFAESNTLTKELAAKQEIFVTMFSKGLESVVSKQEQQGDKLADHAATLRLLTDNVTMMRQRFDGLGASLDQMGKDLNVVRAQVDQGQAK